VGDRSHAKIHEFVERLLGDPMTKIAMKADDIAFQDAKLLLAEASLRHYRTPSDGALQPSNYRRGVGVALFNRQGKIWVGQRCDIAEPAWQLPQGGIDPDENPLDAAYRELREELGIEHAELLAERNEWLRYDLPPELVGQAWGGHWRGQEQRWFAMRFLGADADIDIQTSHPEFSDWYWAALEDIPALAAPFKRDVYADVAASFAPFASDL
jgi:putative (di)nucleoside polyphosphate hydrolase